MSSQQLADYTRIVAAAKREAALLRRQTLNDWLDDAGRSIAHPVRAANRLAASLARHTQLRLRQPEA